MAEQLDFTHKRLKPTTKLVSLCAIAIALLLADNRSSMIQDAKNTMRNALYPVQWVASQPMIWYEHFSVYFMDQSKLRASNQALAQENIQLQTLANERASLLLELNEIKLLNNFKVDAQNNGIMAEIFAAGLDPLAGKLFINKGKNANLVLGQAVIDSSGLIGQITSLQNNTAEVSVATHTQSVIPVMNARTGVRTLLYGNAQNLELRYMPHDADLRANDVLVTSGLDDIYPAGIPVAKVTSAQIITGAPYYKAQTKPMANIDKAGYVLVLPLAHNIALTDAQATKETQTHE